MKKMFAIALVCFACSTTYAQNLNYTKTFPAGKDAIYITNSVHFRVLAFVFNTAVDTSSTIFLIENFKSADLEFAAEKI